MPCLKSNFNCLASGLNVSLYSEGTEFCRSKTQRQGKVSVSDHSLCKLITLVTAFFLAGCEIPAANSLQRAASAHASNRKVVFHITGLVLLVPSKQSERVMHLLLPVIPPADVEPAVAQHSALLGFGIGPDTSFVPRLCLTDHLYGRPAIEAGICYVDLDRWSLEPFGAGGQPTPADTKLPSGLLDVTRLAGGQHRVQLPLLDDHIRSELVLFSGAIEDSCALASWKFEPVNAQGKPESQEQHPIVNVADWVIHDPQQNEFVFRLKSNPNMTITAPLPPANIQGTIEVVLAHVPHSDVWDLPPFGNGGVKGGTESAPDFRVYYDLLRIPNDTVSIPRQSVRRRIPHNGTPLTNSACPVGITGRLSVSRMEGSTSRMVMPLQAMTAQADTSVGTYACMPATGIKYP